MRGVKHLTDEARLAAVRAAKDAYEKRNADKIAANKAVWYLANKERIASTRIATRKRHYDNNRAQRIEYVRRRQGRIKNGPQLTLGHQAEIDGLYRFCNIFKGFEVDHIIPLSGKQVSGLHVPSNLQVLTIRANRQKGNKYAFA